MKVFKVICKVETDSYRSKFSSAKKACILNI